MIAATWNTDLAYEFGSSIGKMADMMDVSGWYAPAMNIHRSACSGRNFEYCSEDPYLSGMMAASILLEGKNPTDIEIMTLTPSVAYNEELCAQLGIEIN